MFGEIKISNIDSQKTNNDVLAWFLLILLSFVWGSSFILIKKSLVAFTPTQVGAGRVVISFLAFLPLFVYHFKNIDWKKLVPLFVVGFCGSGAPAFLYAIGQTEIPSGVAGVLNSMTPIFTLLIALAFFKKPLIRNQIIGILIGFAGILVIFFIKEDKSLSFPYLYAFLILLATFFYGISVNTVGYYLQSVRPLLISTVSFVLIGLWVLAYLLSTDFLDRVHTHPEGWNSLAALATLSLIGTFLANILFFKLIQITEAIFSSTVSFIIPFVALIWAYVDGEYLSIFHFVALMLILAGIFMVKYAKK